MRRRCGACQGTVHTYLVGEVEYYDRHGMAEGLGEYDWLSTRRCAASDTPTGRVDRMTGPIGWIESV